MSLTIQTVETNTRDGKRFLRKVAKSALPFDADWRAVASPRTEWFLEFTRTIPGATGEPDSEVVVRTDIRVELPADHRCGCSVQPFHDGERVYVPAPRAVFLNNGNARMVARLAADYGEGFRLMVSASSGSTATSRLGLAWLSLDVALPGQPYSTASIGETVFAHGKEIGSGPVRGE